VLEFEEVSMESEPYFLDRVAAFYLGGGCWLFLVVGHRALDLQGKTLMG
jgi:hypothetical protein